MISLTIVIVEDDEFLLKKIEKVLKREVTNIFTFKNPVEALNNMEKINPDLIVSDINMPEMTGIDMYKELKNKNINIPIILASAFSEPEYFIEAIKLKVKNFIVKPIDLEDLIVELQQFEKELVNEQQAIKRERMLEIQSKMAAMGEMLANIAHQWKQPLNTISICTTNIELQKEMGKIDDKEDILVDMVDNIKNSVDYMSKTINDFQNYLKPNKLETCFYLKDTLEKVERLISSQVNLNDVKLEKQTDDSYICSYQNELIQVLMNLIKNALDQVNQLDGEKVLKTFSKKEGDTYTITIQDNGGGIPEEILPNIFEPYFTTKNKGGTGIGLHMSKQIVESHLEGTLTATNEEFTVDGKTYYGAKFTVEFKSLKEDSNS